MTPKNVLTAALLLFVTASIVVLTVKTLRQPAQGETTDQRRDGVIAYYFHGNVRCPTCESIEAYAHEAVFGGFAVEVDAGKIDWQVVNFEQPTNEHFARDFDLAAPSVVLVEMRGGAVKRWKNLPEVWELVGDKPAFLAFVRKEVRAFLDSPAKLESSKPKGNVPTKGKTP